MKTIFFVVIVIVFQKAYSFTEVYQPRVVRKDALEFCRISISNLNVQMINTETKRFSLPEQEADLEKFIIQSVAEAMIAKITNEDPEDAEIRFTAQLAVERCTDAPKQQRNIGESSIETSNCNPVYYARINYSS